MEILLDGDCQERWESVPRPEGNEEGPPRQQEDSTVDIEWIQDGNRLSFLVDGVHVGRLPQRC